MDAENIAISMGPTIVGNSSSDPTALISEIHQQKKVMTEMLDLSADYWSTFLDVKEDDRMYTLTPSIHLNTPRYTSGRMHTGNTPDYPIFNPPLPSGGPVAKRTRSKQLSREFSKKSTLFQSPMLY